MVGVPKSTGCAICRKRKIKCDETWPTCVNCQKNGKCCPGPPPRHTFRENGSRLANQGEIVPWENHAPLPVSTSERRISATNQNSRLTELNAKFADNGSVQYKFRISNKAVIQKKSPKLPFLRQPSPSQHHELARSLIRATTTGISGHRMSVFGPFIMEVPSRIGSNPALDAAVAVLVNAHTALVHQKKANEIVSPHLYLRAIKQLQLCLDDPQQGMSANTLCASVLLGLVEALAGPRLNNRYLAHVGGAGRLMELQGPDQYHDRFAKDILRFNRGGIIITAVYGRSPCFLTRPEWRGVAFDKTGLGFDECLTTDLIQYMADFPGIVKDLKDFITQCSYQPPEPASTYSLGVGMEEKLSDTCPSLSYSPNSFDSLDFIHDLQPVDASYPVSVSIDPHSLARDAVIQKIKDLKHALYELGIHLNAKLANGTAAIELPGIDPSSPIPTAWHFCTWREMTTYSCYWSMLIITNKVLMRILPPYHPHIYDMQSECRAIAYEICKTWEDAWASKPIGALHTGLSFVVAYEYCEPHVKEWIVRSLNSLLEYQMVESFRWSDQMIATMNGKLTGEGPDLTFSNVSVSNEGV